MEHDSVQRTKTEQEKPIDVYECLKSFMKEEELGEEDPWCVRWGGGGHKGVASTGWLSLALVLLVHVWNADWLHCLSHAPIKR